MRGHIIGVTDLAHDEVLAGLHADHRDEFIAVEAGVEHLAVDVEVIGVLIAEQDPFG